MTDGLDPRDRQILDLANRRPPAGVLANAVRDMGMTETAYLQRLSQLIDDPTALAAEPMLIGRLRRLRAAHGRVRWMARTQHPLG